MLVKIAKENSIQLKLIKFTNRQQAQKAPNPFTTYSLFYQGEFIGNEILSEKKFLQLIEKINKGV